MVLMVLCGLLLLFGAVAVVLWGRDEIHQPEPGEAEDRESAAFAARRYVWYFTVAVAAGAGAGILVAGAGGRLVMRLLAATASGSAQGRETEADEIVGRISTGGTVGFILFTALFFGVTSGVVYVLIRRWLPRGRLGGLTYGGLLLVVLATRIDPLRADNSDFDLVGPGWLAATAFGLLVLLHGMLVAALAARYSRALPLISRDRRSLLAHAPLLVLLPAAPILVIGVVGGAVVILLRRATSLVASLRSHATLVAGRVILAGLGAGALPGCISTVADIAARQP